MTLVAPKSGVNPLQLGQPDTAVAHTRYMVMAARLAILAVINRGHELLLPSVVSQKSH